jgi:hypothetical protein
MNFDLARRFSAPPAVTSAEAEPASPPPSSPPPPSRSFVSFASMASAASVAIVTDKAKKELMPEPSPANLKFGLYAILIGIVCTAPSLVIGSINEFGPYGPERALTFTESFSYVFVPGSIYLVASVVVVEKFRSVFSTDVLKERSDTTSLRDAMRGNLTNMAVVAALLLTVIIVRASARRSTPTGLGQRWSPALPAG